MIVNAMTRSRRLSFGFAALLPVCFILASAALLSAAAPTLAEEPAAAPAAATPAATAAPAVDTVTVIGTPRTSTTPVTGPRIESPSWRASDPGVPEADTTVLSTAATPSTPASSSARPVAGSGGRSDGRSIPWWVLLLVVGGIAVAAN